MAELFKKLNLRAQSVVHVLNAPDSFDPALAVLEGITVKRAVAETCEFAIAFVISQSELDVASKTLTNACAGDAVLWMAYPKATSKKYKCEFNRDSGWAALGAAGFEPVRMVAIDADWCALRFRRVEYIKKMARNPEGAISAEGKSKALKISNPTLTTWYALVKSKNVRGLNELLADDVVFHSPVVHTPQLGKRITAQYLAGAFHVFSDPSFHYIREIVGANDAVLEFQVELDGISINGVDIISWNDAGRIVDFKVFIRPLKAVNLIHQKMAAMLQGSK